ncbi:hypothetical protein PV11_07707 [Exophiala sideris]|uniref:F-box domain-containing protein n=1 Tax=Exophiala sideris TaxID=1016849 RepID=A0A0D1YZK5_9EURO|nr:hypothetical protein PV11_07707 [Exophiala sideris]
MEKAPDEILLKIFRRLDFKSVANVRLVNKRMAEVGAEALVKKVRFHCSQDSLQRLKNLATHNVFRKYVESVVFEGNILANIGCIHTYTSHYDLEHHSQDRPQPPPRTATAREKRLFERNLNKFQREIEDKYEKYRTFYDKQQNLITSNAYADFVDGSIACFPKLTKLQLSTVGRCKHVLSERFLETFSIDCAMPIENDTKHTKEQLKHLLFPQGRPVTSIRELAVHVLSPKFFSDFMPRNMICEAFRNLRVVDISFRLERDDRFDFTIMSADRCYGDLRKGYLRDALGAASGLEKLTINFEDYGFHGPCADMKYIVGDHVWPKLTYLDLDTMSATEDYLIGMLNRQPSLKTLKLGLITLEDGLWTHATQRMRKDLHLEDFIAHGILEDPVQMYPMHFIDSDAYMDDFERHSMADALDVYVTDEWDEEDEYHPLEDDTFGDPDDLRDEFGPFTDDEYDEIDSDLSDMDCSD